MTLVENNFYTIHLKRRKSILQGIFIYAGTEWILLKYTPVDYVLDGYLLVRTKYIKTIEREENEKFSEAVINLKWKITKEDKRYDNLDSVSAILYELMHNRIMIQFDFHDDSVTFIGEIEKINTQTIRIKDIDPKGNWDGISLYKFERIRTIQFDNDYVNSLKAYNEWVNYQV